LSSKNSEIKVIKVMPPVAFEPEIPGVWGYGPMNRHVPWGINISFSDSLNPKTPDDRRWENCAESTLNYCEKVPNILNIHPTLKSHFSQNRKMWACQNATSRCEVQPLTILTNLVLNKSVLIPKKPMVRTKDPNSV